MKYIVFFFYFLSIQFACLAREDLSFKVSAEKLIDMPPEQRDAIVWSAIVNNEFDGISYDAMVDFARRAHSYPRAPAIYKEIEDISYNIARHKDVASVLYFLELTPVLFSYANNKGFSNDDFWRYFGGVINQNQAPEEIYEFILSSRGESYFLDRDIFNKNFSGLDARISKIIDADSRALLYSRVNMYKPKAGLKKYVNYANDHSLMSEGLMYDMAVYYDKKKDYARVGSIMQKLPPVLQNPSYFWEFTKLYVQMLISEGKYLESYKLLSKHYLPKYHKDFARKEVLNGVVAILAKKPSYAYAHFINIFENSNSLLDKIQAAYFLGMTAKKLHDDNSASAWFAYAAKFPGTYYGQRAIDVVENVPSSVFVGTSGDYSAKSLARDVRKRNVLYKKYFDKMLYSYNKRTSQKDASSRVSLEKNRLFQIYRVFWGLDMKNYAVEFLLKSISEVSNLYDVNLIIDEVCGNFGKYVCGEAKMQARLVGFFYIEDFKVIKNVSDVSTDPSFVPLVHAIIKKESNFKTGLSSGAGARGLMQIMPRTGMFLARRTGTDFSQTKLSSDARYNLKLGTHYVEYLLNEVDGSYPMMLASYNAGIGNVLKWQNAYRSGNDIDSLDYDDVVMFIELIPFYENRHYVKTTLTFEGFYSYFLENIGHI